MKIKAKLKITTQDFFYDLTDGGGLNPEEICANPEDAKKVKEAIALLIDFRDSCEKYIKNFFN